MYTHTCTYTYANKHITHVYIIQIIYRKEEKKLKKKRTFKRISWGQAEWPFIPGLGGRDRWCISSLGYTTRSSLKQNQASKQTKGVMSWRCGSVRRALD